MSTLLPLAFGLPGGPELLIILVIALLLFGRRLPGVARSMGQSINEFKGGLREGAESVNDSKSTSELSESSEPTKTTQTP